VPALGVFGATAGELPAGDVPASGSAAGTGGAVWGDGASTTGGASDGGAWRERDQSRPAAASTTTATAAPAMRPIDPALLSFGCVASIASAAAGGADAATGIGTDTGTIGAVAVEGGVCVATVGIDERSVASTVSVDGRAVATGVPAIVCAISE